MSSHVAHFEHPIPAESVLYRHVPLLCVRYDELARHSQTENKLRWQNAGAAVGAAVVRECRCVAPGETNEGAKARYEGWVERAGLGQFVNTSLEKVGERSGRASAEGHRQVRRLEAQLVHSTDVFANEVNAVAAANCCRVMAKEVIRKSDAGSEAL